jgi:hypothetical protein
MKRDKSHLRAKAREHGFPFKTIRETKALLREKEKAAREKAGLPPERHKN